MSVVLLTLSCLKDPVILRKYAVVPASAVIAAVGLYLAAERVFG